MAREFEMCKEMDHSVTFRNPPEQHLWDACDIRRAKIIAGYLVLAPDQLTAGNGIIGPGFYAHVCQPY